MAEVTVNSGSYGSTITVVAGVGPAGQNGLPGPAGPPGNLNAANGFTLVDTNGVSWLYTPNTDGSLHFEMTSTGSPNPVATYGTALYNNDNSYVYA